MIAFVLALCLSAPAKAAELPFPEAYTLMVGRSLSADPFYGSRLLDGFQRQVQALSALGRPQDAARFLEGASADGGLAQGMAAMKRSLAEGTLDPSRASALLVANALARPDQFPQILDGLETLKPGLGERAADILSKADGRGDLRLIAALRAAGKRQPHSRDAVYGPDGRWASLFDNAAPAVTSEAAALPVSAPEYTGYGSEGRPRPSGLLLPAKR